MPYEDRDVAVDFDLLEHQFIVSSSDGRRASFPLAHRPACADFYNDFFGALDRIGVNVDIHPEPFDLGDSPALHLDRVNASYDADAVQRYWRILASTQRVRDRFQGSLGSVESSCGKPGLWPARRAGRPLVSSRSSLLDPRSCLSSAAGVSSPRAETPACQMKRRRLSPRRVPPLLRQSSDRTDPGRCPPPPARTKCPKATWRPGDIEIR